ncbi:MAG: HD domain-containing phosphohydrolase [Dehalococcoidia bacterium]
MEDSERRSKGRVLVADDSSLAREWISACLTLEGYHVVTASDGGEALEKAGSEAPELALVDVVMPKLGGQEVWRRLKQDPSTASVPVVLMIPWGTVAQQLANAEGGYDALLYKPVSRTELLACTEALLRSSRTLRDSGAVARVIKGLGNVLEALDPETRGHSERVGEYAFRLGRKLGLSPRQCESLWRGAFLHDIGKVGVGGSLLSKPGTLSEEEQERMREHPMMGARILEGFGSGQIAQDAIRHHHERWDGTGYPEGLKGEAVPLGTRILAVVDAYDALVSGRPYRKPLSKTKAATVLREGSGNRYDPIVVERFLEMVGSPPVPSGGRSK